MGDRVSRADLRRIVSRAMRESNLDLLRRLDAYADAIYERTARRVDVGPFVCFLHPTSDLEGMSAVHVRGPLREDFAAHLAEVKRVFAEHERRCELEFFEELWPTLLPQLEANGFVKPHHNPAMIVDRPSFRNESVAGLDVRQLGPDDDLWAAYRLGFAAFEMEGEVKKDHVEAIRRDIEREEAYLYAAFDGDQIIGTAIRFPTKAALALLGFIATAPEHRRRGIAGHLTSIATAAAFDDGADEVWLTAGSAAAVRLYERLGFRRVGTSIEMSLGDDPAAKKKA